MFFLPSLARKWTGPCGDVDFLLGMNAVKRAMVVKLGGGITLTMNGDSKINIKTVNGPKTRVKEAPIGVEFDDEDMDGSPVKVSAMLNVGCRGLKPPP